MNYQEELTFFESSLPIVLEITLGGLAFIDIHEFWHESLFACKGGSQ